MSEHKKIFLVGAGIGLGIANRRLTDAGYRVENVKIIEPDPKPETIIRIYPQPIFDESKFYEPVIKSKEPWYTHFDKFKKRKKMKLKTILTLSSLLLAVMAFGQSKQDTIVWRKLLDSARNKKPDTARAYWTVDPQYRGLSVLAAYTFAKPDTLPVLAYVLTNYKKAKFKWMHMYAVTNGTGWLKIGTGDLTSYQGYLMPDRKTKSIYKVIYSVTQ